MNEIYGVCKIVVRGPGYTNEKGDPSTGKPYIEMTFGDDIVVNVTANLLDMLGGVGKGVLGRIKDLGIH